MESVVDVPVQTQVVDQNKLSSVQELFLKSWTNLKSNFSRLILVNLLIITAIIAMLIGIGATLIVSFGLAIGNISDLSTMDWNAFFSTINPSQIAIPAFIIVLIMVIISIIISALSYAQTSLLGDDSHQTFSHHLKQGFTFIIPLLLINIIVSFIIFGNLFFFIIPGIIAGIFLSLVSFEVILNHKKGMAALRGSATIIHQYFGHLFSRTLIIVVIQMIIEAIVSYLIKVSGDSIGPIVSTIYSFFNIFFSWFSTIYFIELYREVKQVTNWQNPASFTWMWVLAVLGWLLSLVVGFYAITTVLPRMSESLPEIIQNIETQSEPIDIEENFNSPSPEPIQEN